MTGRGTPLGREEYCASCPRARVIPGKTTPIAVGDGRPAPAVGLSQRHLRCWLSKPSRGRNCGNPEVYGVAGEPLVIPTTWALLALRQYAKRRENIQSLAWLEKNFGKI